MVYLFFYLSTAIYIREEEITYENLDNADVLIESATNYDGIRNIFVGNKIFEFSKLDQTPSLNLTFMNSKLSHKFSDHWRCHFTNVCCCFWKLHFRTISEQQPGIISKRICYLYPFTECSNMIVINFYFNGKWCGCHWHNAIEITNLYENLLNSWRSI